MFKINGISFDIKTAHMDAFIDDEDEKLVFGIKIIATNKEHFPEEEVCFSSENFIKVSPNEIKTWQDLAGRETSWTNAEDDDEEDLRGALEVYSLYEVRDAKVSFKKSDEKLLVSIVGISDIYGDEPFVENLPVEIETPVDFYGIPCGDDSQKECEDKIAPFLDIDNLKYFKNKFDLSCMIPKDTDMDKNIYVLGEY